VVVGRDVLIALGNSDLQELQLVSLNYFRVEEELETKGEGVERREWYALGYYATRS